MTDDQRPWEVPSRSGPPPRLPEPPPSGTPFPPIPAGPAPRRGTGRARTAVVALLAALLGGVLGTVGALTVLGNAEPDEEQAATPVAAEPPPAPTIEIENGEGLDRVAAVAEAVLPSVVRVDIEGSGAVGPTGNGSGVIYRSDGHILTNNHVVSQAEGLEVLFNDGSRADAEVVGTDPRNDLAVIKVDRDRLPAIRVGDSSSLKVGELAVAVGSPFGLEGTVTAGVVSALNRPIQVNDPNEGTVTLPNVIQTDASINPGNSGGPLVNGDGELVGINSAILTRGGFGQPANAGVGFAIPVATATQVADTLIETGEVRYAFLGVAGDNVGRELAERLGVDRGAHIQEVRPGTPADDAGLRSGDVIVGVDDVEIDSMEALMIEIMRREIGETVTVSYIRDGERQTAETTLTERPAEE